MSRPASRRLFLISLPLVLAILACQTVTAVFAPQPTATLLPPTALPSSTPSPLPQPTLDPYPYFPPEVEHYSLSSQEQVEIFERLWSIIAEQYLYEDFNGLDWDAIHTEYAAYLESGLSDEEFYWRMDHMVFRLGDDHSAFLNPDQVAADQASYFGENEYVGIGIYTYPVDERGRVVVLITYPGGPAETAGIRAHDSILAVDGTPIYDGETYTIDNLLGEEGSQVIVTIQSPGGPPRDLTITRARITGTWAVPYQVLTTSTGARVGYIIIPSFSESNVASDIGAALNFMGPLDGLILDNRLNGGGYDNILEDTLTYFVDGPVGHFTNRSSQTPLTIHGDDIHGSQQVPLVLLSGPLTASFGEVFAGILADQDRALLIGETTDGNIETLWGYDFIDGSVAWIAHDTFKPYHQPDADWETTGIIPDIEIPAPWDLYTLETDPAIHAALEHFDNQK